MTRNTSNTVEPAFEFSGGRLCLDLANTVERRGTPKARDLLAGYPEMVAWGRQACVFTPAEAERALRKARRSPGPASSALGRVRRLRESIFRVFSSVVAGVSPAEPDLDHLSEMAGRTLAGARLTGSGESFSWQWGGNPAEPDRLIWKAAMSAVDLITSEEMKRLRECAAGECSWLFMDGSRNQSRRWCDMKVCGNRSKVRRHYLRHAGSK